MNLTSHPNTLIGGVLGAGGIGQLIVSILTNQGVHLSASNAAWIAAASGSVVLLFGGAFKYVWAHGISGTLSRIKHGSTPPTVTPPTEAPPPPPVD